MFRYKKSVPVSRSWQGYIYFRSLLYKELTLRERHEIEDMCRLCGGEYHRALLQFVTTDAGATAVCLRHHISRSTLERIVKKYYEGFMG